jgi:hypothetical protein
MINSDTRPRPTTGRGGVAGGAAALLCTAGAAAAGLLLGANATLERLELGRL